VVAIVRSYIASSCAPDVEVRDYVESLSNGEVGKGGDTYSGGNGDGDESGEMHGS
jgi:hypothetical protein